MALRVASRDMLEDSKTIISSDPEAGLVNSVGA